MPPAPIGPSQGGVPAQNLFNWNDTTRSPTGSTTLPQDPNAAPAPQRRAAGSAGQQRREQLRGAEQLGAGHAAQ